MRLLILIIITYNLSFGNIFSQETIIITKYFGNGKQIAEQTSVLKSNPKIKQGRYCSYYYQPDASYSGYSDSWIKVEGYYNHNVKDSIWRMFNDPKKPGDRLLTEEHYKNGKKTGIWLRWLEDYVYERYDYDKNRQLTPLIKVNNSSVSYPEEAEKRRIEGTVELKVIYNSDYSIQSTQNLSNSDPVLLKPVLDLAKIKSDLLKKYSSYFKDTIIKDEIITVNFRLE